MNFITEHLIPIAGFVLGFILMIFSGAAAFIKGFADEEWGKAGAWAALCVVLFIVLVAWLSYDLTQTIEEW